ncbi:MAG TPA: AraC family transcriptional regulator [Planctomycetota bacterium]|nr:AraC family transcriptional regulator [Planctomycetota bacterium]
MATSSVSVIAGGLYHCDPRWSKPRAYRRDFNRIYVPISGGARYCLGGAWTDLRPGSVYLIPAHAANAHVCERAMRVHWLHFTADGLPLTQRLAQVREVLAWPEGDWRWWRPMYRRLAEHVAGGGAALSAAVHAFALAVAGAALDRVARDEVAIAAQRERFAPAIALIERRFPAGVPIPLLARASGIGAVQFRRAFTAAFGVPPHAFIARRRMDQAAALLAADDRAIAQVARACGYEDPFYFSRAFRRHHRASPTEFRRARHRLP